MAQKLKYVIGKDYRPLTMLEAKSSNVSNIDYGNNPNWVQGRQYEDGLRQVFVEITNEDGSPFDLMGANVLFEGILPDGEHKILDNSHAVFYEDPSSGKFRFDLPAPAFSVAGQYKQAFFRITKGYRNVATLEFKFEVLGDMVVSGLVPRDYISPLDDLFNTIKETEIKNVAELKAIVDEKINEINNLMTTLNQTNTSTLSELNSAKTALEALEDKIKQDGLFTQAEAEAFRSTLTNMLSTKVSSYATVDDMKNADLKPGEVAETMGYHVSGDRGGARYIITQNSGNSGIFEELENGNFAKLDTTKGINILQLGAKNNGVDDVSHFFEKAIPLGLPIFAPAGKYKFATKVNLDFKNGQYSSTTIFGEMPMGRWTITEQKTIFISPDDDFCFVATRDRTVNEFSNICFKGYGLENVNCSKITKCEFTGKLGLSGSRGANITDSSFHNCDIAGIKKITDSWITNNVFYYNAIGIDLTQSNDDMISSNKIEWNEIGINADNAQDHVITSNIFDRNSVSGFVMNDFRASVISDNFFERNLQSQIEFKNTYSLTIQGNRFFIKNSMDDGSGQVLPINTFKIDENSEILNVRIDGNHISQSEDGSLFLGNLAEQSYIEFSNNYINDKSYSKLSIFLSGGSLKFPAGVSTITRTLDQIKGGLRLKNNMNLSDITLRDFKISLGENEYFLNEHLTVYHDNNNLYIRFDNVSDSDITFNSAYFMFEPKLSYYLKF